MIKKFIPWLLKKLGELFTITIPDWIKWLFGPKGDGDAGINIPDKIDIPDVDVETNLVKGDWSLLDEISGFKKEWDESGSKILYFSPKLDNRAQVIYTNFKNDWKESGSKILYFSPKLDNRASVIYNDFKSDWNDIGSKILYFSPKLDNTAKVLYDNFKKAWDELGSKILYFSPKLDNIPKVLYDGFKKDWDESGSKVLYFSPKLDNTATVLYDNFMKAWNVAGSKILYFSPKMDNTAKVLYDGFKNAWDAAGSKILYFSPKLDNAASVLWGNFKKDWLALASRILYMSPQLDKTASLLWSTFKTEWDNIVEPLKITVEADYSGINIGEGFGGATGGGVTHEGGGGSWSVTSEDEQSITDGVSGFLKWAIDESLTNLKNNTNFIGNVLSWFVPEAGGDGESGSQYSQEWYDTHIGNTGDSNGKFILPVTPVFDTTDYQESWDKIWEENQLNVTVGISTKPADLASTFKTKWNNLKEGNRTLNTLTKIGSKAAEVFKGWKNTYNNLPEKDRTVYASVDPKKGEKLKGTNIVGWLTANVMGGTAYAPVDPKKGEKLKGKTISDFVNMNWLGSTISYVGTAAKKSGNLVGTTISKLAGNKWLGSTVSYVGTGAKKADNLVGTTISKLAGNKWLGSTVSYVGAGVTKGGNLTGTTVSDVVNNSWKGTTTPNVGVDVSKTFSESVADHIGVPKNVTITAELVKKPYNKISWTAYNKYGNTVELAKSGGVIDSNGIKRFASGGSTGVHGTMFLAGEAGPEIVGHVGGRSEVLNKSQLASTMYAAVRAAMAPASANFAEAAQYMYYGAGSAYDGDMELLMDLVRAGSDATQRQNDLLRQQNELLRQINDKEFTAEYSTAGMTEAQRRTNRRAGTTVIAVGT